MLHTKQGFLIHSFSFMSYLDSVAVRLSCHWWYDRTSSPSILAFHWHARQSCGTDREFSVITPGLQEFEDQITVKDVALSSCSKAWPTKHAVTYLINAVCTVSGQGCILITYVLA